MPDYELSPQADSSSFLSLLLCSYDRHTHAYRLENIDDFITAASRIAHEEILNRLINLKQERLTREVEQALGGTTLMGHIKERLGRRGDGRDPLRQYFRQQNSLLVLQPAAERFVLLGYENPGLLDANEQPLAKYYGSPDRVYFDGPDQARNTLRVFWTIGEELRAQQGTPHSAGPSE